MILKNYQKYYKKVYLFEHCSMVTFQMNRLKQLEDAKMKEKSVVKELREEIGMLKKWKETAIIETVDKDR
jgi:hypothetical protein